MLCFLCGAVKGAVAGREEGCSSSCGLGTGMSGWNGIPGAVEWVLKGSILEGEDPSKAGGWLCVAWVGAL